MISPSRPALRNRVEELEKELAELREELAESKRALAWAEAGRSIWRRRAG